MTLSAHIQFIPLHHAEPMAAVDVAIGIIQSSGLAYEVGPFGTSVEGASNTVEELVRLLLHSSISKEFLLNYDVNKVVQSARRRSVQHWGANYYYHSANAPSPLQRCAATAKHYCY